MQQVIGPNVDSNPKKGYIFSHEEHKKKIYKNETHIHKQNGFSPLNATAHKLYNDIFTYFPKGFMGSKNSDFYEYLSLGMVPYLIGSVMMYYGYKGANRAFNFADKACADSVATKVGAGILLYGIGKWASKKLSRTLIHASTGVDLDMLYLNKKNELPEFGQEKGLVRTQYPGVFDSVTFYRSDLLDKDSELNHDNDIYWYNDKIARKAGYTEQLNAPNQTIGPKIKALKARATALENITKYIAAATGVALGTQKSFENIKFDVLFDGAKANFKAIPNNIKSFLVALKEAFPLLWNGSNRNFLSKYGGKILLISSVVGILLNWLIPSLSFKKNPDTMKSKVDTKKDYEVC